MISDDNQNNNFSQDSGSSDEGYVPMRDTSMPQERTENLEGLITK